MRLLKPSLPAIMAALAIALSAFTSEAGEYSLVIDRKDVDVGGRHADTITLNGQYPGPLLRFTEGEDVTIHVTNKLKEDSSVHWHGFLLPGQMDGVPGLNGFHGIKPGETFTYRFSIRQSGTYWYHSHSGGQEQEGLAGPIVIDPSKPGGVKNGSRLCCDADRLHRRTSRRHPGQSQGGFRLLQPRQTHRRRLLQRHGQGRHRRDGARPSRLGRDAHGPDRSRRRDGLYVSRQRQIGRRQLDRPLQARRAHSTALHQRLGDDLFRSSHTGDEDDRRGGGRAERDARAGR